ncbi:hypothetical protein [Gorillibacterium sp. sgz500922]|uniref:hypothetical protein n=1 Tax=Gorillibacterium sp. sgz500922 TaxID=3446694 RepID=UPI003F667D8A
MFDPTVYENVKVVLEGAAYELDEGGRWYIGGREDLLDLAAMSRTFRLKLIRSVRLPLPEAKLTLSAGTEDLAAEILELRDRRPGCGLGLVFICRVTDPVRECKRAEEILRELWGPGPAIAQTLSQLYGREAEGYLNSIEIDFRRRFDEGVIQDMPGFLEHIAESLVRLARLS